MYLVTVSESSDVDIINFGQLQLQNTAISFKVQNWLSLSKFLKQAAGIFQNEFSFKIFFYELNSVTCVQLF